MVDTIEGSTELAVITRRPWSWIISPGAGFRSGEVVSHDGCRRLIIEEGITPYMVFEKD